MNKQNNNTKIYKELKSKVASLKRKIKNTVDKEIQSKLNNELWDLEYKLSRGSPFTQD